jgi:molybdopterin-containing oxidoreductase family iron-sulfur binding subunit
MTGVMYGMVIHLDRCTGCGVCAAACRVENNVAPGGAGWSPAGWMVIGRLENGRAFPESDALNLPRPCMHCERPPCVAACPVGATVKSGAGGIVSQNYARCIGCRACMKACPYGARRYNMRDPVWPKGMEATITSFASVRPKGVVEKCTLCAHRLVLDARGGPVSRGGEGQTGGAPYVPACAEACPTGAIAFGNLAEIRAGRDAFVLKPGERTGPQVFYVSSRGWAREKA